MPEQAGTLELIARELATALQPLEDRLAAGNAEALLVELGIQLPGGVAGAATATATVAVKAGELAPLIVALTDAINDEDAARILSSGLALLNKIKEVVDAVGALKPAFATAVAAAGGLTPAQRAHVQAEVQELPARLLEHLAIDYLKVKGPGAVDGLKIARIIDDVEVPGVPGDITAPPFTRVSLRLDRGIKALTHPADYLQEAFAFGAAGFDGLELFTRVASFLDDRDVAVTLLTPPGQPPILEAYLLRLGVDPGTSPPSLTARLRWPATQDWTRTYPLSGPWSLVLDAKARFDAGLEASVKPPFALTITPPSGAASIDASGSLQASKPGDMLLLLGQAGASRMEARSISVGAGLKASATSGGHVTVEPTARAAFEGGHILIDLASGDGFIAAIAGGAKIDSNFDLRALWAPSTGLQLEGSAALEIAIPTHVRVGPIDIRTIYLRSGIAADGSLPTELSGSFARLAGADRGGRRPHRHQCHHALPGRRREPRPGRHRLRLQAAQRRRALGRRRRGQGRRLPVHRRRARRVRRRPRARPSPASSRSRRSAHHHQDARRLAGLLAADHHHRRVRHRHPAGLRLHPAGGGRPARAEPDDEPAGAHRGRPLRRDRQRDVPARRRGQRAADHQRPARRSSRRRTAPS